MLPPIVDNISQSIGSTPMIRLTPQNKVNILAKLEFTNPTGSVKDRLAKYLLDEHEKNNSVDKEIKTLIIPTSGNLGISIATLAARRGYRIISILPERTSNDRIALLKALGVEILRSPNEVKPDAAESAYSVAARLAEQLSDAVVMDETKLRDYKPYHDLAEEILQQTKMAIDFLFVGAESGAMLTGVARYLKDKIPELKVIGVEPTDSVLSGEQDKLANRYDWKIEDLGNNFVTKSLDKSIVDEWIKISDKEAFSAARRLIRDEGILCGPSSGAVVTAAARHAQTVVSDHSTHTFQSVVILNDSAKNYTSTLLSDDWLFENDLADDLMTHELEYLSQSRYRAASVEDLQLPAAVTIPPTCTVGHAIDLMLEREYSQLPVINPLNRKLVGYVSLSSLQEHLVHNTADLSSTVESCMFSFKKEGNKKYQVITPDTSLADLAKFFEKNSFAVITDANRKWCLGVATKYDLISFLHRRQFL
ncbi:tryptophan synthase beta subunit-like PLP-dependent enzyme [Rhizopus microsporus var. microsporus]|uniref:Cystathionine beta-synthase, catalyzes the synthesis of cystathionine from serine and homocysteine n=2 Tax=Rhizopus microsporus TaxID=58291 RepID=A0A2G4SSQ1_RHIZD|nr:cystathionine beta-synthase, catalyzes the synthesis of cystathionine from serine and homocysteine [Rhizopus microsporus ATCC 52813]ORE03408.1 tryptophan synthase beta subunit-like PLP-dependent enzyme [Rhizopus microsporus var. microsporus]PHZ11790.1 cystathionine beta-synthase, catalyzes the synthesis of cystathionine from serine and homocysteine [Rhizopus microsporus ATCC 52813]